MRELPTRQAIVAIVVCAILILQFFTLSLLAVHQKNATWDEHTHALGAYCDVWLHDFRVDFDNFSLWKYWAALPDGHSGVVIDTQSKSWEKLLKLNWIARDDWSTQTFYRTPGNDADIIVNRSRTMMLLLGVALVALVAVWSYQLGGAVASIFATALIALDPNFLGHSPLIKNDIPSALVTVGAAYAAWRVGRRATVLNIAALTLLCGAALNVKASGFILAPLILLCLLARALLANDWEFLNHVLRTRIRRVLATALVGCAAVVVTYIVIWACYDFRFNSTPDPAQSINMELLIAADRAQAYQQTHVGPIPPRVDINDCPYPLTDKIAKFAEAHQLFPQAWLCGVVYISMEMKNRTYYLCGNESTGGWWYYFPLASLFKLPMASLVFVTLAALSVLGWCAFRFHRAIVTCSEPTRAWSLICVVGVALFLLTVAIVTRINLGVRHIFAVYALAFVTAGWIVSVGWRQFGTWFRLIPALLIGILCLESFSAYPNYIAFFNRAVGGTRGGVRLLADSNLDWGQDLKALGVWAHAHPTTPLYLCYSNLADPSYYGIDYTPILSGYRSNRPTRLPRESGVVAIDATAYQGWAASDKFRRAIQPYHAVEPFEIIGGTIYLYQIEYEGGKVSLVSGAKK